MKLILLVAIAAFAAGGCGRWTVSEHVLPATPDETLAQVEAAVDRGDVSAMRALLSADTIAYVRQNYGAESVDLAVEFMMHRCEAERLWQIVGRRDENGTAVLTVQDAQQPDKQLGELTFVREDDTWKLHLVEEFQAWNELAEWAIQVEENVRKAPPFFGGEGSGRAHGGHESVPSAEVSTE